MAFNFNIEGAITAILGLLLPFIFFITFRPRTILVTLKQRIEELRGVLRDVEDENLPEDPSHLGWVEARERLEKFEDQARSLRDEVYRDCLTSKLSEVKAIVCGLTCKLFSLRRKVSSLLADVSAAATYARRRQQDAVQQYHTVTYIAAARGRSATEAGQNNDISMEQHRQLYTLPNRQTSIRVAEDINPTTISIARSALQHVGDDSDSQLHSTVTSHPSNNEWNASAHVPLCEPEVAQDTGVDVSDSDPLSGVGPGPNLIVARSAVHPQNPLVSLPRNIPLWYEVALTGILGQNLTINVQPPPWPTHYDVGPVARHASRTEVVPPSDQSVGTQDKDESIAQSQIQWMLPSRAMSNRYDQDVLGYSSLHVPVSFAPPLRDEHYYSQSYSDLLWAVSSLNMTIPEVRQYLTSHPSVLDAFAQTQNARPTDQRKTQCMLCSRYIIPAGFAKHIAAVHLRTTSCSCSDCGLMFSRRDALLRHQVAVHDREDLRSKSSGTPVADQIKCRL